MKIDTPRDRGRAALDRGNALFAGPSWRESRVEFEDALRWFEEAGDVAAVADAACNLASVAWRLSDLDRADSLYEQARQTYVQLEAWWHVATVEQYLGNVAYSRGDLHRARWYYDRARLGLGGGGRPRDLADCEVNLAGLLVELGDPTRALDLLSLAARTYENESDRVVKLAEVDRNRGLAHRAAGDLLSAWRHTARSLRTYQTVDQPEIVADLRHNLADIASDMGRFQLARALYGAAIATYETTGGSAAAADSRLGLGAAHLRSGDRDAALRHLLAAETAYRESGEWLALARTRHNLALLHPDGSTERIGELVPPLLAMQSISWGLPEPSSRVLWRDDYDGATSDVLEAALSAGRSTLLAELVEALRAAPLVTSAAVPAGVTAPGTTVHDLPAGRPCLVDCGWSLRLRQHLPAADELRGTPGPELRVRTHSVELRSSLLPEAPRPND